MTPTSYVRAGFMRGLEQEAKLGVNPFKSGIIGSSDAHNALPFVEEDNFFGKFPGRSRVRIAGRIVRAPARARAARRAIRGSTSQPATRPCGPPRTRAKRSSTR